jgi:thiamine-phosphate pyrophosphorylase
MIAYAIIDPKYLKENATSYLLGLQKADWVLYRNKSSQNYEKDAIDFLEITQNSDFKVLLHQDYKLAAKQGVWGVHLNSMQLNDIKKAKALGLFTIMSTHTIEEVLSAQNEGADAVTFSPIFSTPNKGAPKGVDALKELVESCSIKVIALGGILSSQQLHAISATGAFGFASIRYFITHK